GPPSDDAGDLAENLEHRCSPRGRRGAARGCRGRRAPCGDRLHRFAWDVPNMTRPRKKAAARRSFTVQIIGAGKVGTALARLARAAGVSVAIRAGRAPVPRRPIAADLAILAVRDGYLEPLARALADSGAIGRGTAVVHCAGALGPEVLAPLRAVSA